MEKGRVVQIITPGRRAHASPDLTRGAPRSDMAAIPRRLWLAALGVVDAIEDAGLTAFGELVERGEAWEARSSAERVEHLHATPDDPHRIAPPAAADGLERTVDHLLDRINVASRDDLDDLSARITQLTATIDRLAASVASIAPSTPDASAATEYHVVPAGDGWAVRRPETQQALSHHAHKDDAVRQGRSLARRDHPGRLIIHRLDGSVQDAHHYDG